MQVRNSRDKYSTCKSMRGGPGGEGNEEAKANAVLQVTDP